MSIHPSFIHPSKRPSIQASIHLSACLLSIRISICHLYLYLLSMSVYLSIISLSIMYIYHLYIYLSIIYLSFHPPCYLSIHLFVYPIYPSVHLSIIHHCDSQPGIILPPPRGHLATCMFLITMTWGGGDDATGTWWVETRDPAQHPAVHKTAHHRE